MVQSPYNTDGLPGIRAGAAQTAITPPVGVSLAGYFHNRVAKTVRDDLFCRAVVFEAFGVRIVLVSCDLISVGGDLVQQAKEAVNQRTGIPAANVLICATHTHTGPETRAGRCVPTDDAWLAALPGRIGETVADAGRGMFDAFLFAGRREETRIGSNRLGRCRDASEVFGKSDVIGRAGPIDPEMLALAVKDGEGNVRAMVVNYAMHPDVIGGGSADFISADWPGELGRNIARFYGDQAVTLLLNGTCGDINHHTWEPTRQPRGGPHKAVQMGRALAGLAINATETAEPAESAECGMALEFLDIPYYTRGEPLRSEIEAMRKRGELRPHEEYTVRLFDEWPFDGRAARVPVQVLRLGELAFVGLPGEVFVRWGLEIKHWSPGKYTFVAELANDWFGYIPTTDQAQRGAYGAKPILSRRLCADAGRQMADAAQTMMWRLWEE